MAITDLLGTNDSQGGNIVLGNDASADLSNQSASNTLTLTQSVTLNKILNLGASNTLGLSSNTVKIEEGSGSNTIAFSHDVQYLKGKFVLPNNTLIFSQTTTAEKHFLRTLTQNLNLTQIAFRNIIKSCIVSNTFNLTQTVTVTNTKFASNTLVFSQSATYFVAKGAKNTIVFTQTLAVQLTLNKSVFDFFGVGHQVITGPNTFRRSLNNTLALNQIALGFAVKGVNQSLSFSQNVIVNKVKGTQNLIAFGQNIFLNVNYQRSPTDILVLRHSVLVNKIKGVSAQSIFAPIQSITKTRIRTATASSIFGLTHELVKTRYLRDLSQNIVLTQGVVHQRIANPSIPTHTATFTQTVRLNKVLNLACANTLVFKNSFERRVSIGGQTTITVPLAQVIKVKNIVVLRGTDLAITLPAPEFDDSEAYTGSVNIIRFKTGGKRTYKNDTQKSVLDYTFVIERNKKNELKYFISQYNSKPFYLENWKGEIWYVMFNTNPFVITEAAYWEDMPIIGGNKYNVPLSFEGVRLN